MIKLGQKVRDKVTGFEGIATTQLNCLYGCTQFGVTPEAKDGAIKSTEYFDEGRLEMLGNGILPEEVAGRKPGGPNRDCPR